MIEEFQQIFNYLRHPLELKKSEDSDKKTRRREIYRAILLRDSINVPKLIFESIGKDTFSSVMDMKYTEVTAYYGAGNDFSEIGRFYNKFWEFDVGIQFRQHGYISGITLKKEGTFGFAAPADKVQNVNILNAWLEYFKGQCRTNRIKIKD